MIINILIFAIVALYMLLFCIWVPSKKDRKTERLLIGASIAGVLFLFWWGWHRLFGKKDKDEPPSDEQGGVVDQFMDTMK